MADPFSILGVAAATAAFRAYTQQNPTTDSVDPQPGTDVPSEQYATQKNKQPDKTSETDYATTIIFNGTPLLARDRILYLPIRDFFRAKPGVF